MPNAELMYQNKMARNRLNEYHYCKLQNYIYTNALISIDKMAVTYWMSKNKFEIFMLEPMGNAFLVCKFLPNEQFQDPITFIN